MLWQFTAGIGGITVNFGYKFVLKENDYAPGLYCRASWNASVNVFPPVIVKRCVSDGRTEQCPHCCAIHTHIDLIKLTLSQQVALLDGDLVCSGEPKRVTAAALDKQTKTKARDQV